MKSQVQNLVVSQKNHRKTQNIKTDFLTAKVWHTVSATMLLSGRYELDFVRLARSLCCKGNEHIRDAQAASRVKDRQAMPSSNR